MKHPLAMDSSTSESDASEEDDFARVQNMGSQRKRVRTYSKTGDEGKPLKKARRVEVAFEEDKLWENIIDSCIKGSTRGNNVDKKQRRGNTKVEGMSNKNSKEENLFLFQSRSRGEVGKLGQNDKKSSSKGKGIKSVEDGTPKRPKKLPLAPASKSSTEEDCSYGWQQSCWQCSRRSSQLRLCSACQVAAYCSNHCQREAWLDHEERCKRFIEEKECEGKASTSILNREEIQSSNMVEKGEDKIVKRSCKAQADDRLTSACWEVGPGPGGEVLKTVCFNSQPQFAPSQEMTHFDGEARTSPLHPKSILKSPKVLVDPSAQNIYPQSPVRSPPIDLTEYISSPSQSNPTPPPPACQLPKSVASPPTSPTSPSTTSRLAGSSPTSPSSPSTPSSLDQVKVTPPNSPSVLLSIKKSSQAKPKSEKRRRTPYPQEVNGNVKLVEEVEEGEESDEQEGGADVEQIGLEVEDDPGLWLKPQRLDFADISDLEMSKLDFDSNCTDQEGSTCDELNTVQEIQFSSQSTEDRGMNRSPDMFSSQGDNY